MPTPLSRFRSFAIHPGAVVLALPVLAIGRALFYMDGEGWTAKAEYFLYVLSEGWPFWLAYLIAVILLSQLFRAGHHEDVIDR